jgi:uncharacterized protein involved in type VI secretion and phage assembly
MIDEIIIAQNTKFQLSSVLLLKFKERVNELFECIIEINPNFLSDRSKPVFTENLIQTLLYEQLTLTLTNRDVTMQTRSNISEKDFDEKRYITGVISDIQYVVRKIKGREEVVLRLTIKPMIWLLSLSNDFRCYVDQAPQAIIQDILTTFNKDENLTNSFSFEFNTSAANSTAQVQRKNTIQYGESDLDFLLRLMDEEGLSFYFTHTEKGHKLIVTDNLNEQFKETIQKNKLTQKPFLIRVEDPLFAIPYFKDELFYFPYNNLQRAATAQELAYLANYSHEMSAHIYKSDIMNYDFREGNTSTQASTELKGIKRSKDFNQASKPSYSWTNLSPALKKGTKPVQSSDSSLKGKAKGEFLKSIGMARYVKGQTISFLTSIGQEIIPAIDKNVQTLYPYNTVNTTQSYYLFETELFYLHPALLDSQNPKGSKDGQITSTGLFFINLKGFCSDDEVIFPIDSKSYKVSRQTSMTLAKVYQAPQGGGGDSSNSQSVSDDLLQIKIQFLWQQPPQDKDSIESPWVWARLSQTLASDNFGTFFCPNPGDEVIVLLENEDHELPIIVGSVYNSLYKPYLSPATQLTYKSIKNSNGSQKQGDNNNSLPAEMRMFTDDKTGDNLLLTADTITIEASQTMTISTPVITINLPNATITGNKDSITVDMKDKLNLIIKDKNNTYSFTETLQVKNSGFDLTTKSYKLQTSSYSLQTSSFAGKASSYTVECSGSVKIKNLTM